MHGQQIGIITLFGSQFTECSQPLWSRRPARWL